jgi:hypothetical protein
MQPLRLIVLLTALLLADEVFSQQPAQFICRYDDKECAVKAIRGHAITKLDYWKQAFARPVDKRIGAAPPELVEYLTLDNIQSGFPDKPRPATLRKGFLRDVRAAISELPHSVKQLLPAKLAGIYFVQDLGGTGYTDEIVDARSNPVAGFVVLDMSVLNKAANAWATWKENTPFKAQPGFRLTAAIESREQDSRKNAIQYILLHELGHVLTIGEKIHPPWNVEPKDVASPADYPFFSLSWIISKEDNRYLTIFDDRFPQRKDVVYYLEAKLPAEQMVSTYDNLERTDFATLYSVTKPGDDFAEAFASYVHAVLMKKPFEIRIYTDGKIAKVYKSCWYEERCAAKRRILEDLLK